MAHYNHWPLVGRSLRGECKPIGGTANPHEPITCPHCRAMIGRKIAAHTAEAARSKPGSQDERFFTGDAAHWQSVLDRHD